MTVSKLDKEPFFSVIIPAYNAEKFIHRAIGSVINQTFGNWELIIVENGSADRTTEVCAPYMKDNRISLTHSEKGVSNARNKGIELSKGSWIVFLDADDILLDNALEEFFEISNSYQPDLMVGKLYGDSLSNEDTAAVREKSELKNFMLQCLESPTKKCTLHGVAFYNETIKNNRIQFETDIRYAEDSIFFVNDLLCCKNIVVLEKPVYKVFYNSASTIRSNEKHLEEEYLPAINRIGNLLDLNDIEIRNYWYVFTLNQLLIVFVNDVFARKEPVRQQKADAMKIMEIPEYKTAIQNLDLSYTHGVNKIMFTMMKRRMMTGISMAAHYKRKQNLKKAERQNV